MSHPPRQAADERTTLLAFLGHQRDVVRRKCGGLDATQLDTPLAPSDLTLGGMLKHLAYVEGYWSRVVVLGESHGEPWDSVDWSADADWDWHSAASDEPDELWRLFEEEVTAADRVYAGADLDELVARPNRHTGDRANVRWVLVHLVEEYARHAGHADLIRQAVDGQVG